MRPRWRLCAAAALFAGCKLGPDYVRPAIPVPDAWRSLSPDEVPSLANEPWWDMFEDPVLQELIRTALEQNKDLKIAIERIEEARALYGFTHADLFPKVDVGASAGAVELSEERLGVVPGSDLDGEFYTLEGRVSWELDIFGRVQRASESQLAILFATEEARRAVVITLVADVASAYVEMRDLDESLEIARRTLVSRGEYVQLALDRYEGGLTSELDWRQAQAEYHRVAANVASFEFGVAVRENELAVLLGRNPGPIRRGMSVDEMPVPPEVPAGLPSDLLTRRPDVRFAEDLLISANAGIGAAKALLYPRIALTGAYGWESSELDDLLTSPAQTWSFGANLLAPIFNAGQNRSRVEVAESQQRQALYEYELAILRAFREVEDALAGHRFSAVQRAAQDARVIAERQVLALADLRYRGGVASYLEVLDAQRSLFDAELDMVQSIRDHLVSVILLYKALGGGWMEEASTEEPVEPEESKP